MLITGIPADGVQRTPSAGHSLPDHWALCVGGPDSQAT